MPKRQALPGEVFEGMEAVYMHMGNISRYSKAVASIKGTLSRLLFTVGVLHVYQIIRLEDQSLAQMHNTMLTVLGTVMCMRVNEMDQLQICEVLWHFDAAVNILDCTQPLVGH